MSSPKKFSVFWYCAYLSAFCIGIVVAGHYIGKHNSTPKTLTCAIATPISMVATITGDVTGAVITDFGVVKSEEFVYHPGAGEVCLITSKGDNTK